MTTTVWVISGVAAAIVIGIAVFMIWRQRAKVKLQETEQTPKPIIETNEEVKEKAASAIPESGGASLLEAQAVSETVHAALSEAESQETTEPEAVLGEPLDIAKIIEENIEEQDESLNSSDLPYNIGKSGKHYTAEELELLIKE